MPKNYTMIHRAASPVCFTAFFIWIQTRNMRSESILSDSISKKSSVLGESLSIYNYLCLKIFIRIKCGGILLYAGRYNVSCREQNFAAGV